MVFLWAKVMVLRLFSEETEMVLEQGGIAGTLNPKNGSDAIVRHNAISALLTQEFHKTMTGELGGLRYIK
ncbi:hypothetical protein NECAME_03252 [Necator americanus]|uniref:Uncharacterized protein n=1 Tax=Necator americanus TaxID=51031 RepID=W2T824_NECAM|nr:hypothetical protein NECAME_03252 [Necator americanus]ETN77152.1 hypothetical protein NECAME_03252 [Necator americanus]